MYGHPRLVYKAANGCLSELFDHECHPAVLYILRGGSKSQAIPGRSVSSNFLGTIISASFISIKLSSFLKPIPFIFLKDLSSFKSSTLNKFEIA